MVRVLRRAIVHHCRIRIILQQCQRREVHRPTSGCGRILIKSLIVCSIYCYSMYSFCKRSSLLYQQQGKVLIRTYYTKTQYCVYLYNIYRRDTVIGKTTKLHICQPYVVVVIVVKEEEDSWRRRWSHGNNNNKIELVEV